MGSSRQTYFVLVVLVFWLGACALKEWNLIYIYIHKALQLDKYQNPVGVLSRTSRSAKWYYSDGCGNPSRFLSLCFWLLSMTFSFIVEMMN